ncbi:MAG: hypothetical protein HY736_12685 [Verrucomicrobia bacterium]|nr:hypothetical protein [Verrucomicrobiota bacterium]
MVHSRKGRRWLFLFVVLALSAGVFSMRRRQDVGAQQLPASPGQVANAPEPSARAAERTAVSSANSVAAPDRGGLFAFAHPPDAAALDAALPAPAREILYVRLNAALIAGKQSPFWQKPGAGRIELPLPGGGAVMIVIEGSEMLGADRFTSAGGIEGRPLSRAVFAYNEGFLHASIEDPELGRFALRTATEELSQYYQVDPALVPPCGGTRRPLIDGVVVAEAAARRARVAGSGATGANPVAPATAAAENPQRAEVHVMIVYTEAVLPTLTGAARTAALQSAFDAAIAKVNNIFAASLITARVKLVGIAETQYDERVSTSTRVQDDALTALQNSTDGKMDEIHALRDRAGADIVCLALNRADSASSGLSFLIDRPHDTPENLTNPLFAFSVVQYSNIAGTNVVPHELGHVLGCAHDRANALSGPGAYPYSYGYKFFGADGRQYHDIMAYPPGTELGYFSNPNVIAPPPVNAPIGIARGLSGESETAYTIEQNAFQASIYRLQTQAAPNPGTLINVATRAFVGTGSQVLIGGFVVDGAQRKKLLLRAAGPALAAFGVIDALDDPVLRIFSGQSQIAASDNWGSQPGAGDVANAAAQIGAFAFAPGSADAALLVTLEPGAYTAIVEGVNGATGFGLVEAYDADRTGNRIVNLSTRGYADNRGREMIGGFVVQGVSGATKRILIRVLGPTLARAPFNVAGVMEDPHLELYDAAGQLLVRNDDWSTGARFVSGTRDDFQPFVRQYGEQQISATGFAPANRREPCVMADLPPGNYTVVVKPFELRSSIPSLDEPAEPGIGLIEVYEINR